MKLVTFTHNGRVRIGEWVNDKIYGMVTPDSMAQTIRRGITASRTYERFDAASVSLEAPLAPGKIIAIGKNYADHAKETGSEPPTTPIIFAKLNSAVIGHGAPITWRSSITQKVDWEGELAVIIGKRAKDVPEEKAYQHVFGYTIANDVSARDLQLDGTSQWTRGKGLDTFCPLGPCIVTREAIPDPHALTIQTFINDEQVQNGHTGDMIFKIPYLIAYITRHFTLEPGDVILTGTPAGVGNGMKPPRFLKDGDTVRIRVEGIGELVNPCKVIED